MNISATSAAFPNQCKFTCRLEENIVSSICDFLKRNEGHFNLLDQIVWQDAPKSVHNQYAMLLLPMLLVYENSCMGRVFLEDDSFYKITNLKLCHFNGLVSSTQRFTEMFEI